MPQLRDSGTRSLHATEPVPSAEMDGFCRIFGVETEYGVAVTGAERPVDAGQVAMTMFQPIVSRSRSTNTYLANGSRLYLDVGSHPEYATAEARDPRAAPAPAHPRAPRKPPRAPHGARKTPASPHEPPRAPQGDRKTPASHCEPPRATRKADPRRHNEPRPGPQTRRGRTNQIEPQTRRSHRTRPQARRVDPRHGRRNPTPLGWTSPAEGAKIGFAVTSMSSTV